MFFNKERIQYLAGDREVVFWGCSEDWVPKTQKILPQVSRIVDINKALLKDSWRELTIMDPDEIKNQQDNIFIVITTGSVDSVVAHLLELGFIAERDFCYSPFFEDFSLASQLTNLKTELIFTSSDYGTRENVRGSSKGGGIYKLSIDGDEFFIDELMSGSYRQAQFYSDKLYAIEYVKNELQLFDSKFAMVRNIKLSSRHYTGLSVSDSKLFLVSSADDIIEIYERETLALLKQVPFSEKSFSDEGLHHLNDCYYDEGRLFFSYFSRSGAWRKEIFDGGISFLDIESDEIVEVQSGLFQPHSPKIINDALHFCESPKGKVYSSSWETIAQTSGFVRGIAYQNGFYFIGQSETLYMKRAKSIGNVMMNSGIYILEEQSKCMRFYPTFGIKNIHCVLSIPQGW